MYTLKASDVVASVINGQVVLQDGRVLTLDEAALRQRVAEYARAVRAVLEERP